MTIRHAVLSLLFTSSAFATSFLGCTCYCPSTPQSGGHTVAPRAFVLSAALISAEPSSYPYKEEPSVEPEPITAVLSSALTPEPLFVGSTIEPLLEPSIEAYMGPSNEAVLEPSIEVAVLSESREMPLSTDEPEPSTIPEISDEPELSSLPGIWIEPTSGPLFASPIPVMEELSGNSSKGTVTPVPLPMMR